MKKLSRSVMTSLASLGLVAAAAVPAAAFPAIPNDMHARKYYSGSICVGSTLNPTYYPVGAIAQQWNNAVTGTALALDFSTDCAADGYSARQSMVVSTFSNPNAACLVFTNTTSYPFGDGSVMSYWQHRVGVYVNTGNQGCVSTAQRRAHQVAAGIGYALGLDIMTTSGYASRVMCTCSLDTVRSPDDASAYRVWQIYNGIYGG